MQNAVWSPALEACADPRRAQNFLEQLATTDAQSALASVSPEQARVLVSLLSGSQASGEWLITHPDQIGVYLDVEALRHRRRASGLRRDLAALLEPRLRVQDYSGALGDIRQLKQREMVRMATRDLARLTDTMDILLEISNLADACIAAVYQVCEARSRDRWGTPYHLNAEGHWQPTPFCVLGLGKLGGRELNYSSDVDLMFLYDDEGWVFREPPSAKDKEGKGMASHSYFQRLVEAMVTELTRASGDGVLYRVDLRLRPEGDGGPLARSLSSYESYYAQWGQTWERMMLIKARGVAGESDLAGEFLEAIQTFRYPRSLSERALTEITRMKQRTEAEVVKTGEIRRNVKLGWGGIREIEFIAQSLQLLRGGKCPFLQNAQTLPTLQQLVRYKFMEQADADALTEAYCFLRDVEHRLQMENNLQTHTIPTDTAARRRLAALMGCPTLEVFEEQLSRNTTRVRAIYDKLLQVNVSPPSRPVPRGVDGHEDVWRMILREHAFQNVDQSLGVLKTFIQGPGYVHVSPRTVDLALQLVLKILEWCPKRGDDGSLTLPEKVLSDPDRVLARLDTYIAAYGTRTMLYETWASNPSFFEMLLLVFDRSEYLAETAIRTPDIVEGLAQSGQLQRRKTAEAILRDLRHGVEDKDQLTWLRRYHQTEFMRIGLRDILGLSDFEQNLAELSALADACLEYALEIVMRKRRFKKPPFVIIGLGKLGGDELTFGSDLDITFVAGDRTRNLPKLQRVAAEVMELLSSQTQYGVAFITDARLRPDGKKGMLVNTLKAYEDYYRKRAQLWELQALSRTRPVAGDLDLGKKFQALAADLTDLSRARPDLAAYQPDWKVRIAHMRRRIEKERTPKGKDHLAIKTGTGGLIDAEFIAQALSLGNGWHEANTLSALHRARDEETLSPDEIDTLTTNYRRLRLVEGVLRRWSFAGETVLPDTEAPLYRVAIRCGCTDSEQLLQTVGRYRRAMRRIYNKVFPSPPAEAKASCPPQN